MEIPALNASKLAHLLYFLYIRNPLFTIVVFISMLWKLKANMFFQKNSFLIV